MSVLGEPRDPDWRGLGQPHGDYAVSAIEGPLPQIGGDVSDASKLQELSLQLSGNGIGARGYVVPAVNPSLKGVVDSVKSVLRRGENTKRGDISLVWPLCG